MSDATPAVGAQTHAAAMRDQILEAVRQVMAERSDLLEFERMRLAFQMCQERLATMEYKIAHLEQTAAVYQELSQRRREQSERLQEEIAGLTEMVALLKSAPAPGGQG
ncbi:MAG: hypothetical protein IAE79_28295 [Anaerolinea sp.]|nr:hypothetical protein [Anaerolinea sp.]